MKKTLIAAVIVALAEMAQRGVMSAPAGWLMDHSGVLLQFRWCPRC